MPKSGSTLAFRLAVHLYEWNGHPQELLPTGIIDADRRVNFVYRPSSEAIERTLAIVESTGHPLVLKTHGPPTPAMIRLLRTGQAVGHAIFRDPREIALSMLDHGAASRSRNRTAFSNFRSLEQCVRPIELRVNLFKRWAAQPGVTPWYYDDFAWDKAGALVRLQRQTQLEGVARTVLETFDSQQRVQYNKAEKQRWKTDMTSDDSQMFENAFAAFYASIPTYRKQWRQAGSIFGPTLNRIRSRLTRDK